MVSPIEAAVDHPVSLLAVIDLVLFSGFPVVRMNSALVPQR